MSVASAEGEQAAGDGTDRCAVLAVPPTYADPACHTCGRYSATTSAGVARTRVPSCRTTSTPPSDPAAPTALTGRPASARSAAGREPLGRNTHRESATRVDPPIATASPSRAYYPPYDHQGSAARIRRAGGPQPPRSRVIHSRHSQGQIRPSAAPRGAGRVSGMPADTDDDTCPWQIRDRDGWRHGVLFTASADLLVAWYTATASLHRRTWATANHRYGTLVQRVRQARLRGDADELEQACRALLHHAQARPWRAPLIRDAFTQLHQTLAWVADDADICLIGGDTCQHPPTAQCTPSACSRGTGG